MLVASEAKGGGNEVAAVHRGLSTPPRDVRLTIGALWNVPGGTVIGRQTHDGDQYLHQLEHLPQYARVYGDIGCKHGFAGRQVFGTCPYVRRGISPIWRLSDA